MNEHGLAFDGLDEVGLDGVDHPGGHGARHLQIFGGHGLARPVVGHDDAAEAFAHVLEVAGHGKDGHDFGRHGNVEMGGHHEAVGLAAHADDYVAQGLTAEVDDPVHAHVGGIDVQTGLTGKTEQLFVVVVAFVLHAGGERHHGQVVGVGDGIDVAGEAQGVLRERNALGKAAARRGTLGAHGGTAGRLTDGRGNFPAALGEALHETDGGGGFAFPERSRGYGRHIDILTVGTVAQTGQHGLIVHLAHDVTVGEQFFVLKAELSADLVNVFHAGFRVLSDFPVRVLLGIQSHVRSPCFWGFVRTYKAWTRLSQAVFVSARGWWGRRSPCGGGAGKYGRSVGVQRKAAREAHGAQAWRSGCQCPGTGV